MYRHVISKSRLYWCLEYLPCMSGQLVWVIVIVPLSTHQNERSLCVEICQNERSQRVEICQTADISTNTEMSIDCLYTKFCSDMNRSVTFVQLSFKRQSSEGRRGMLSFHFIRPSDFPGLVLLDVVCHGTAAKGPCFQ